MSLKNRPFALVDHMINFWSTWKQLSFAIATFEIYSRKFTGYLILICSFSLCSPNNMFQKWTVLVFTLSWSCDQLMQKAYSIWIVRGRERSLCFHQYLWPANKIRLCNSCFKGMEISYSTFILLLQVEHNLSVISGMMLPIILEPKQEKVKRFLNPVWILMILVENPESWLICHWDRKHRDFDICSDIFDTYIIQGH